MLPFHHSNKVLSDDVARAELGLPPITDRTRPHKPYEGDLEDYHYGRGAGLNLPMPVVVIPETLEGLAGEPPTPPAA